MSTRGNALRAELLANLAYGKKESDLRKKQDAINVAYAQLFGTGLNLASSTQKRYMMGKYAGKDPFSMRLGGEGGQDVPYNLPRGNLTPPENFGQSFRRGFFLKPDDFTKSDYSNIPGLRPAGTDYKPAPVVGPSGTIDGVDTVPMEGLVEGGLRGSANTVAGTPPGLLSQLKTSGSDLPVGNTVGALASLPGLFSNLNTVMGGGEGYTSFGEKTQQKRKAGANIATTLLQLALMFA